MRPVAIFVVNQNRISSENFFLPHSGNVGKAAKNLFFAVAID